MAQPSFTSSHFDGAYYERFYKAGRRSVSTQVDVDKLGRFVCAYLGFLGHKVGKVIDLGCGLGHWKSVIGRHYPKAKYVGVELSEYLCETHGWSQGSVIDWETDTKADLVICQGVLQYLGARDAKRAIRNLACLTSGALYLEALTAEDWENNCDQNVTDGGVNLRPAAWYRKELDRRFTACGGGLFISRESPIVLYELERASTMT